MNCNIKLILENLYGTNFGKLEFSTDIDLYILATIKQRIWREMVQTDYLLLHPQKGVGELGRVHCVSLKVPYWQLENKEFGGKWCKQTTFSSIPKKR